MYIILGGTGNIGSSVAKTLLEKGKEVTVLTHSAEKVSEWEQKGAKVAVVDVYDTDKLHEIFKTGKRLFLLNPPADITKDTVVEEKQTVSSILKALENSGIEKVVAESTYGAQPGDGIGDLGVLYEMEEKLRKLKLPVEIIRAAYYMSNWASSLETAEKEGKVYTFYPIDFKLPMVAPADIGKYAAELLISDSKETTIHYFEGPEIYTSADVAEAFSKALNKPVESVQIPEDKWLPTFKEIGFSDEAAQSMAAMTKLTLEDTPEMPESPIHGLTTLYAFVSDLVSEKDKKDSGEAANDHLESFQEFLKEREKASQAYVNGDGEPLVKISAAKSPATFFSPGGDFMEGAEEIAARYKKDAEMFDSAEKNEFQTLQMNADENIAFWVGLQKSVVTIKGEKNQMTLRVTEIFRRDDGNWKMIHRHADFLKTEDEKK